MISCKFEDGNGAYLRHVTVNALVVKDGKVLLGKRGTIKGKALLEAGKWALIGGFMARDEDAIQAVRREIMEESGWEVDNIRLFHIKHNPDRPAEDRQNVEFVFLADAVNKTGESDEEVSRLQWFSPDEFPAPEEVAFDHGEDLELYKEYLKDTVEIPVFRLS